MAFFRKRLTPDELLINAIAARDLDEVRAQLAAGADPNACDPDGVPAAVVAASHGRAKVLAALLNAGLDPSLPIKVGKRSDPVGPLLNLPAANGSLACARVLLAAGAPVDDADPSGLTPLMCAAHQGHEEMVRLLLEAGASLEQRDQEGYTALMFAANEGESDCVCALLEAGADVNATDREGSTALMFAAQHGDDEAVVALLRAGADPEMVGDHGLSAIGFAQQNRHSRTLRLLKGKAPS